MGSKSDESGFQRSDCDCRSTPFDSKPMSQTCLTVFIITSFFGLVSVLRMLLLLHFAETHRAYYPCYSQRSLN